MLYKTLCNTVELVLISREIVWINDSSYSDVSEQIITQSASDYKTLGNILSHLIQTSSVTN